MKTDKHAELAQQLWLKSGALSKQFGSSLGTIHGLGLTEFMVLHHLMIAPNHLMRRIDIADAVARTASGITRTLAPMEKLGLIKKEANARDARVSLVTITAIGKTRYAEANTSFGQQAKSLFKNYTARQLNEFLELLGKLS